MDVICFPNFLEYLTPLFFPGNRKQQRVFLAIFIELKYAPAQFIPHLTSPCDRYGFSPRMPETVRSSCTDWALLCMCSDSIRVTAIKKGGYSLLDSLMQYFGWLS